MAEKRTVTLTPFGEGEPRTIDINSNEKEDKLQGQAEGAEESDEESEVSEEELQEVDSESEEDFEDEEEGEESSDEEDFDEDEADEEDSDLSDDEDDDEPGDSEEESDEDEEGDDEEEELDEEDFEEYTVDVADLTDGLFETEEELREYSTLLKENPELKEMVDFFKAEGTVLPYLQATQVNYDNFSTEDLLRIQYAEENGINPQEDPDFELLFQEDVMKKYKLDSSEDYEENEVRLGKKRAELAAKKVREKLKKQQSEFKLPVREDQGPSQEEIEAARKANRKKFESHLRKHIKNNKLKISAAGKEYDFEVSPKDLNSFADTDVADILLDNEGNFDIEVLAFLNNRQGFKDAIAKDASVNGKREFIKEKLKNKKKPKGKSSEKTTKRKYTIREF